VSEKTKKQVNKLSTKATPSSKGGSSTSPEKMIDPTKPLIISNTEEGGMTVFLWGLLFIVVVGCSVYATKPLWTPFVINYLPQLKNMSEAQPPEDLLMDRIDQLQEEIVSVRKSGEEIADLETERSRLNKNFEGVMARILALENQIDNVRRMKKVTAPPIDSFNTNKSLNRLNSRMIKLEKSDERASAVLERLNKLEQMISERDTNSDGSDKGLSQIMTDISRRIGTLESGAAQSIAGEVSIAEAKQQVRAQSLVLAVGHLRESLRTSDPFVQSLKALRKLGGDDKDIISGLNELTPFAKTGVPTMDILRIDYKSVAESIRAVELRGNTEKTIKSTASKVFDQLTSLISIRKTDSDSSGSFETGPIKIATAQLDQGDLEGAIVTLAALSGTKAALVAPWLVKARGRLIAETTLSKLHVIVVSILATAIQ
jgi:hypothetical protein